MHSVIIDSACINIRLFLNAKRNDADEKRMDPKVLPKIYNNILTCGANAVCTTNYAHIDTNRIYLVFRNARNFSFLRCTNAIVGLVFFFAHRSLLILRFVVSEKKGTSQ